MALSGTSSSLLAGTRRHESHFISRGSPITRPLAAPAEQLAAFRASRCSSKALQMLRGEVDVCRASTLSAQQPPKHHDQPDHTPIQSLKILLQHSARTGNAPPPGPCNRLLQECARSVSQWPDVWAVYTTAETSGAVLRPETYTALWQAALEAGWMRQGVQLFRRCAAVWGVPSLRAYTALIARLLKGRRRQRGLPGRQLAHAIWQELKDAHSAHLDGPAVRAGVAACCAVGQVEVASELLRWASRVNLHPGLGSYNRLIMCHCERGDMIGAQRVFARLRALCAPDAVTWNTLAWGYARLGDVASTRGIMAQAAIMAVTPDMLTWSTLIHAYARSGDMVGAEQALTEARTAAATAAAATAATAAAATSGRSQHVAGSASSPSQGVVNGAPASAGAAQLVPPPPRACVSIHAYGALVDGYMRLGDAAAAELVVRRMHLEAGHTPNRTIYNTLIRGYLKLGVLGLGRAFELFGEMRAAGVRPGADTYTMLLAAAGEAPGGGGWVEEDHVSSSSGSSSQLDVSAAAALNANGVELNGRSNGWPSTSSGSSEHVNGQLSNGSVVHLNGNAQVRVTAMPSMVSYGPLANPATANRPHARQLPPEPGDTPPVLDQLDSVPGVGQGAAGRGGPDQPVSRTGQGRIGALMRAMHADGIPADAAVMTTLMMSHARAGRTQLALAVFDELLASPVATVDVPAWNALVAVHVAAGQLAEASVAAERAAALAVAQGHGAPEPAFGALLRAHAELQDLPQTLRTLKRFLVLGGRPGKRMLDPAIRLCLEKDSLDYVVKVLRAAELTGVQVDHERYRRWIAEWKSKGARRSATTGSGNSSSSRSSGPGSNPAADGLERMKWWLGLPNTYYSDTEWDRDQRRKEEEVERERERREYREGSVTE